MAKLLCLFGYLIKKMNKLGYVRTLAIIIVSLSLILLYLQYSTRPFYASDSTLQFHTKDSLEYCNSPSYPSGAEDENLDGYSLKQVQMLIRHGDRAPISLNALLHVNPVHISCSFNNSNGAELAMLEKYQQLINKNIFTVTGSPKKSLLRENFVCNGGQLTPYGFLQHIYNGEHLKNRYQKFLSHVNVGTDIHVQTTNWSRTIQSSAAILTGLFREMLHGNRIHLNVIRDYGDAHMLLDEHGKLIKCPALAEKSKLIRKSKEFLTFKNNIENMMTMFAKILLLKRESMPVYSYLIDILFTKLCHGQGIPCGPRSKIPRSLVKQALSFAHIYTRITHSPVAELQALSLYSQIAMQALNSILHEDRYKKLVLYSGHDSMVTPFLQVLGMSGIRWPPYASRVVIEFFQKDSQNTEMTVKEKIKSTIFRVIYNGVVVKNIKFCLDKDLDNSYCSLSDLIKYVTDGKYNEIDTIDATTLRDILFTRIKNLCSL